jgi:hypothetical protein
MRVDICVINSATIHPIISRLGVDVLLGHMTRVREHDWFKSIGPESMVLRYPSKGLQTTPPAQQEGEIWLDWSFVDFWKSNQRALPSFSPSYSIDLTTSLKIPSRGVWQRTLVLWLHRQVSSKTRTITSHRLTCVKGPSAESAMLINSLKDVIRSQVQEIDALQLRLKELSATEARVRGHGYIWMLLLTLIDRQLTESKARIAELEAELQTSDGRKREVEKEQEDLLVLLDDMSTKRRRDKQRMREAGMDVSEDEADDDNDDDDEDEGGEE